jgi:hypothetical protein
MAASACRGPEDVLLGSGPTGTAAGGAAPDSFDGRVLALVLVEVATRRDLRTLVDGDRIDLSGAPITLRADVEGDVESVVYEVDGEFERVEQNAPWTVAGNDTVTGVLTPWRPSLGDHRVKATPFSAESGTGQAGTALENVFTLE